MEDAGIIRAVCAVADELGIEVLAEQVAAAQVLATVQHLGCDLGQVHHLGRPVPAEELWIPRAVDVAAGPTTPSDHGPPYQPLDHLDAEAFGPAATR